MFHRTLSIILSFLMVMIGFIPYNSSYAQVKDEYTIAVLDLEAIGVSLTEAEFLSESLRGEVTRTSVSEKFKNLTGFNYKVIEQSQMDKIFDQFDIQNTGCTDVSCAIEFGKMLSVQRIIIGSVGLVGKTYSITIRMVDVETAETVGFADYKYTGEIDELLKTGVSDVVNEIMYGEKQKKSNKKIYYIIGGIVLFGGIIAATMSGDSSDKVTEGAIGVTVEFPE